MTQFLKFHEWKQQTKPQFEFLVHENNPHAVIRISDGDLFVRGELVSDGNSKYKIFKFAPDKIHVILVIYPHGHMRVAKPINSLIKHKTPNIQNDPVP